MTILRFIGVRWALVTTVFMAGCETFDLEKSKPLLPGERHAYQTHSAAPVHPSLSPLGGRTLLKTEIALPPMQDITECPQPGCSTMHVPGHRPLGRDLHTVWSTSLGASPHLEHPLMAAPVVADGRLYALGCGGRVTAVDTQTGHVVWTHTLTTVTGQGDPLLEGLGGGLALEGGRVFVALPTGDTAALEAATGAPVWQTVVPHPVRSAPTVSRGRVFLVTVANSLEVLAAEDGQTLWSHEGLVEPAGILSGNNSPAVIDDTVILALTSGEVLALRAENGVVLWETDLAGQKMSDPLANLSHIVAPPVIDRGFVLIASNSDRTAALDLSTGRLVWEAPISSLTPIAVAGEVLFIAAEDNTLRCLERATGHVVWSQPLDAPLPTSTPQTSEAPKAGPWFGPFLAGHSVVVLSDRGEVRWFDPANGAIQHHYRASESIAATPVVAEATLFLVSKMARLSALRDKGSQGS